MMILRSSPPSPFGRTVKLAIAVLGLKDKIEIVQADTNDPNDSLRSQNPLGKIPALILENGKVIFDSRVILDYLDGLAGGGKIITKSGDARFDVLVTLALANGLMEAALLQVYEGRYRDADKHEPKWLAMQVGKVERALAVLEASPPAIADTPDAGAIGVACGLGYLDLRFGGKWRADHPRLVKWLDAFAAKVPAFEETRVKT
ncbi:MAG: glutathione S-transferase family protein [Beijerinckiaceae bacterium]